MNILKQMISFIGAGSMAESIIKGLLNTQCVTTEQIQVTNRSNNQRLTCIAENYHVIVSRNFEKIVSDADVLILAMKPKDALEALLALRSYVTTNHIVLSVMAGISTNFIESVLEDQIPVIRAMPNTSSEIGFSATTVCTGKYSTFENLKNAIQLFESIGSVFVVDEKQMDVTTAIAGSGPAYFYYIADAIQKAALIHGIGDHEARMLIADTLIGAGEMLKQSSTDLGQLRKKITSPGGTTAAGIQALMEGNVHHAFISCITAAVRRSQELEKG
ncbi:pyrroline-5-carboxylate reductase [Alkalihalobacillus sp. AL-G]|uniref:pyrroline-5-carboxylate reductase n=1 Tax=Alkalihalobacillus sp. AL-G TaxID=2926399 RepID=UPI00272A3822|nr:pyrroline-5-carboxylate reductase [Alkalihalobacillus sp. AL-G]WLD91945.1 pyrroline-5-carboxylate reductase [Alkalihalobacillus sp. AL-G]